MRNTTMILEGILNRLISNQREQTSKSLALVLLLWSKKHGGSVSLELGFHRRVITAPALFTWTLCPDRHYGATEPPWTGATDSPLEGLLSPIQHSKWRGRWWRNGKGMKWLSGGSPVGRKQKPSLMPTEALPLINLHPQNIRVRDWMRDSDF